MMIQEIWLEAEQWAANESTADKDNSDVIVTLDDGSKWVATFFSYRNISALIERNRQTGECLNGKYFWASDMILVEEISRQCIEEVIRHLLREGSFRSIFSKISSDFGNGVNLSP